jgi:O-acetyl-ADP-ribose deacetylase (regulator of RNase III)
MRLEDLSSEEQAKIRASRLECDLYKAIYRKAHECCPKCGETSHWSTLAGYIMDSDNKEAYKDLNNCECSKCGDNHTCHERVPKKSSIKLIDGNLVRDADQYEVILHGCNCQNTMGKGIALQIKEKFPEAYDIDSATKKGDINKLGTISHTINSNPIIVNCYTQFNYRPKYEDEAILYLDYNALTSALSQVKKKFSGKKIGMPRIGAQLAGGDWNIIIKIIEQVFEGEDVTIVNYVP